MRFKWKAFLRNALTASVFAAALLGGSAGAAELDLNQSCSLTLTPLQATLTNPETAEQTTITVNDGAVTIYKVGDLTYEDGTGYVYDVAGGQFADVTGLPEDVSETLRDDDTLYTQNQQIAALLSANLSGKTGATQTIANGTVSFSGLTPGLYLVAQTTISSNDVAFGPFLVNLPSYDETAGAYVYDRTSRPKTTALGTTEGNVDNPPSGGGSSSTPVETEPPSPGGGSTTTPPSGGGSGSGSSSSGGGTSTTLPQTGQLWWPVPVLACIGLLFVAFGMIRRKRS